MPPVVRFEFFHLICEMGNMIRFRDLRSGQIRSIQVAELSWF